MSFIPKIIFIFCCSILLVHCTKDDALTIDANKAVVEAYLIPGQPVHVKITKEISYSDNESSAKALTGLEVYVNDGTKDYLLSFDSDSVYSSGDIHIISGNTYTLHFAYNNKEVKATTEIPYPATGFYASAYTISTPDLNSFPPSFPDPVTFYWNNSSNDYHTLVFKCIEANPERINDDTTNTFSFPQTEPDKSSSKEVQGTQFTYYGKHYAILYTVLPGYVALFKNSGSSSQNIKAIETNVENGLGIFTGMAPADTLTVTVQ